MLPFVQDIPISRSWSGLMPFTCDGKPIIERLLNRSNLFVVSSLLSSGFVRGPSAGKLVADFIKRGESDKVLAESDPSRCVEEL